MEPAAERMRERVATVAIRAPRIPVLNNADLRAEHEAQAIRAALVRQVHAPVRWVETVRLMAEQGIARLVECGPGRVLTGLNRRIAESVDAVAVYDSATLDAALAKGKGPA